MSFVFETTCSSLALCEHQETQVRTSLKSTLVLSSVDSDVGFVDKDLSNNSNNFINTVTWKSHTAISCAPLRSAWCLWPPDLPSLLWVQSGRLCRARVLRLPVRCTSLCAPLLVVLLAC